MLMIAQRFCNNYQVCYRSSQSKSYTAVAQLQWRGS